MRWPELGFKFAQVKFQKNFDEISENVLEYCVIMDGMYAYT